MKEGEDFSLFFRRCLMNRKKKIYIIAGLAAAVAIVLAVLWRGMLVNLLWTLLGALFLAYLLNPLVSYLGERAGRNYALFFLMSGILVVLLLIAGVFVPQAGEELAKLVGSLPENIQRLSQIVSDLDQKLQAMNIQVDLAGLVQNYIDQLPELGPQLLEATMSHLQGFLAISPWLFSIPIITFYFLKDKDYFATELTKLIPAGKRAGVKRTLRQIDSALWKYLRGTILLALIMGTLTGAGLAIIGIPYWLLLGILMFFFNFIPYFGPILAAIPILLASLAGGSWQFIFTLGLLVVTQSLQGAVLAPKITGDSVKIHPLYIMVLLLAAGQLFGVAGMLTSVPIMLMIRIVVKGAYRARVEKKTLGPEEMN